MIALVWTVNFSEVLAGREGRKVDGLKNLGIHLARILTLKRVTHEYKGVGKSLYSQSDRAVTHVAVARLRDRVIVAVDDLIEVECSLVGYLEKLIVVKGVCFF